MRTRTMLADPLTRCKVVTATILSIGFVIAATIFLSVTETVVDPLAEFEQTKKYSYELERIGGKATLAANSINNWFAGLWHGRTLSYTVAAITIIFAALYYFIATSLEADAQELREEDSKRRLQDK